MGLDIAYSRQQALNQKKISSLRAFLRFFAFSNNRLPTGLFCVLVLLGTFSGSASAQTCGTPGKDGVGITGGIVNTYFPGTSHSSNTITVGSYNTQGASTGITPGDLLLVMQMQDANINSSNSSAYGDGASNGSGYTGGTAGRYEYVVATNTVSVLGGTITLSSNLINTYTNSNATTTKGQSRFQVVRVPQYSTATLSSIVTAAPWNGSSGGIVAIDVAGNLNFGIGSGINVTGQGFRGGGGRGLAGGTGANTDYRTLSTNNANGSKGEGIAGTPRYIFNQTTQTVTDTLAPNDGYPGGSYARGAPGNAGGGGTDGNTTANDQNSGGGGGGNSGAGSRGGNTWNSNLDRGGIGGAPFSASSTQLIMGGGGGAGTTNNSTGTPGGGVASSGATGGGIVMLRVGSVTGGTTINANGSDANQTVANDAGGGGGAGGSVLFYTRIGSLTGVSINARGGRGGDAWLTQAPGVFPGNRHGPGGGGGGGYITQTGGAGLDVTGGSGGRTTTALDYYGVTPGATGNIGALAGEGPVPGVNPGAACSADLSISKTGTAAIEQGGAVSYTIEVTNNGPTNVTNSVITDVVPANITGVTWSCAASGSSVCNTASGSGNNISLTGNINVGSANKLTLTVSGTASTTGNITNTATVRPPSGITDFDCSGSPLVCSGNNTSSQATNITPPGTSPADLAISKTGTVSATLGGAVSYTIRVWNNGSTAVTNAAIADAVPANIASVTWTCAATGTAVCNTASGSGNNISLTANLPVDTGAATSADTNYVTISVSGTASTVGSITNTATVTPPSGIFDADCSGSPVVCTGNNTSSQATAITGSADLAVSKTGTATALPGSAVSYTIRVWNNGANAVNGVSVTDNVPSNITGVTWTCAATGTAACGTASGSGNNISLSANLGVDTGAATSADTSYITLTVNGTASTAGNITNTATVAPPAGYNDPDCSGSPLVCGGNNSSSQATNITAVADLAISKTGTSAVTQGSAMSYTIRVWNNGTSAVTGATIADVVPANVTTVTWTCAATGTATCGTASGSGNTISLTANLPVDTGAATTADTNYVTVTINGTATTNGNILNTATVTPPAGTLDNDCSGSPLVCTGNNTSSQATNITNRTSDVSITKTGTATVAQGGAVSYTLVVRNAGTNRVTGAVITDIVPANITGVTWTCTGSGNAACSGASTNTTGSGNVNITAGEIRTAAGDFLTIVVTGTATTAGSITNTATVVPPVGTADPNCSGSPLVCTGNNTASQPTTITGTADLAISKTGTATVTQNNPVSYTIRVWNNGANAVSNAVIADAVPSNITSVTWTCAATGTAVCNTASGSGNNISLSANLTVDTGAATSADTNYVTITVNGTASSPGSITNTAVVTPPSGVTDSNCSGSPLVCTGNNTSSQATTINSAATPPNVTLLKSCTSPANCTTASQLPGTELTYQITFTNIGGQAASNMAIIDRIPLDTDFKVGTATANAGSTGLTFIIEYSDNYDPLNPGLANWNYPPASAGGGAPADYDRNVRAIRWRVTSGNLSQVSPNNTGNVRFVTRIR